MADFLYDFIEWLKAHKVQFVETSAGSKQYVPSVAIVAEGASTAGMTAIPFMGKSVLLSPISGTNEYALVVIQH